MLGIWNTLSRLPAHQNYVGLQFSQPNHYFMGLKSERHWPFFSVRFVLSLSHSFSIHFFISFTYFFFFSIYYLPPFLDLFAWVSGPLCATVWPEKKIVVSLSIHLLLVWNWLVYFTCTFLLFVFVNTHIYIYYVYWVFRDQNLYSFTYSLFFASCYCYSFFLNTKKNNFSVLFSTFRHLNYEQYIEKAVLYYI